MSQALRKIFVIVVLFIICMISVINNSQAVEDVTLQLYTLGSCGELLTYKGETVETEYVFYPTKALSFPGYCIDKNKPGVDGKTIYEVKCKDYIKDSILWRYVINGYPYKSIEELGCKTMKEAYMATQQAIYCYLCGYKIEDYKPIGEAGKRTLNALIQIVNSVKVSQEMQLPSTVVIKALTEQFIIDDVDENYASKTYEVIADAPILEYRVLISALETDIASKQLKIVDENNVEKGVFKEKEKFKILVPIELMKQEHQFKFIVNTYLNSKGILEGTPENPTNQPYALTADSTELIHKEENERYAEDKGSIKIIKQDKDTKERIENVEFSILDKDKNVIYDNLKTNKKGEIYIENLAQGIYYVQETNPKEGYVKNEELIQVEVGYNQQVIITIDNIKENVPDIEIEKPKKNETPKKQEIQTNNEIEKTAKKLPVTGM